jgi:hypothetical protein
METALAVVENYLEDRREILLVARFSTGFIYLRKELTGGGTFLLHLSLMCNDTTVFRVQRSLTAANEKITILWGFTFTPPYTIRWHLITISQFLSKLASLSDQLAWLRTRTSGGLS